MVNNPTPVRIYSSPERRERRNRTQLAILKAAQAVFKERGYGGATMQAIADSAGVSLPTVYLYFGSKPNLLGKVADLSTSSAELDVVRVLAEPDPARQLEIGAGILRRLHQQTEVVADTLRTAAGSDPELFSEYRRWQDGHLGAVQAVARSLADKSVLRDGVDAGSAGDILYAIGGPDTYRQLVRERGWTPKRYERWLADAVQRLLL